MGKIEEVDMNGEKVFLKKNKLLGWSVVYPIRINGTTNLKNLFFGGNFFKLGVLLFLILIILMAINEYFTIVKTANECLINLSTKTNLFTPPILNP